MDREEAEKIKLQILERRNYLKSVDVPLTYSKSNLYGGMQSRVNRQSDKSFKNAAIRQKPLVDMELNKINDYIKYLDSCNAANLDGAIGTSSTNIVPAPNIVLPAIPKRIGQARRSIGINGR